MKYRNRRRAALLLAATMPAMSALAPVPLQARRGEVLSGPCETGTAAAWDDQIQGRSKAGAPRAERLVPAGQNTSPQMLLDVRDGQTPHVAQGCSNLRNTREMKAVSEQSDGQPDRPIQKLPEKLPVLDFEQTLEAELNADDIKTVEGSSADFYHFQGKAFQKTYLEVRAEFETVVTISHPDGFQTASIPGWISVISVCLPSDGDYTIGITSVDPATGPYTINLSETAPPSLLFGELLRCPPAPKKPSETPPAPEMQLSDVPRLEFDRPIHETLGSDAPCSASSGYKDCYRIEGKLGQKIALTLNSNAFDTLLELGGPEGFYKQNDDGPGEGTDSMLAATLPANGTYYAGVSSYKGRRKGAYVLTLSEGRPDLAATEPPNSSASIPLLADRGDAVASGGTSTRTMGEDETVTESLFQGRAGQRLHIISKSDDTPAKFELIGPDGHRWRSDYQIDRMDEREALVVTLPVSGEYQILHYGVDYRPGVAYKFSTEEASDTIPCQFRGNIKDRPPGRFASGGTLILGADVCGNITPSDPLEAGRHADTYEIFLTAQAAIEVLLRGYNWDLPWAAEGEITGPQGFRRSLPLKESPPTLVVPATGVYKIQVLTSRSSAVPYGDYELLVRPGGGPWTTTTSP